MFEYLSIILILVFGLISIITSIKLILIGKNKLQNIRFNTEKKRKFAFIFGIISIILLIICEMFFIIAFYYILYSNMSQGCGIFTLEKMAYNVLGN
jgi:uncharacterized membrane protein